MKRVFADTWYWVAIARPGDQHKRAAQNAKASLGQARLVTTDGVLMEFLAALSNGGPWIRGQAAKMTRAILGDANTEVIAQDRKALLEGLGLYEDRPDKGYSLVDCISMNVMYSTRITEVLTDDQHFSQERFTALPGAGV